ncbi:MAG: helix-turn-helix transcriptional regulator [Lentisphaeria bacterium]|nr:helix-turn-helix transcriptional regulator [Lentisphaeria bacterium]
MEKAAIDYFSDLEIVYASRVLMLAPQKKFVSVPSPSFEFIRRGSVTLEYGERKLFLRGPVLAWVPPGAPLRFINETGDFYDHLWVNFSGERGERIIRSFLRSCPQGYIALDKTLEKELEIGFMSIVNDFQTRKDDFHDRMVFTLEKMIWELRQYLSPLPVESNRDSYGMGELAQKIALNPFEEYDFPAMAKEKKISLIHFRRLFKEVTGLPLHQYLLQQKIIYCARLLSSGKYRVKEVALACDFPDLGNFSRLFRRFMHCSPREYLRREKR